MTDQPYLVAARKYRPKRFDELVAQAHVTDTLKNALRLDRLAHAYLFSGPRGVGKTTAARILAKAINCQTPREERPDEAEPCRECASCEAFEEGRSLNVIELDAASNNKVDDIRELRETVRIPPQGAKKKVYIIDEVHMLSNQAFNALLKTLEEPPPHVLFIFATTEPHKVLPTILSRCQRFDFRRVPVPAMVGHLRHICEQEGIEADEESLMLLARKGDGALRDALSAFDQAVSLCGAELKYAELAQAMGVVDVDLYFRLTTCVRAGESAGMLRLVEEVVRSGYDLQEFLSGLSGHLRNLLIARTMDDLSLIEAAEATRRRYAEAAEGFSEADLLRLLLAAGEVADDLTQSARPRLKLEMALLKMAALPRATDLREALDKLDRLEALAREGKLAGPPDADEGATPDGEPSSGANGTPAATTSADPDEATPQKGMTSAGRVSEPGGGKEKTDEREPPPSRTAEPAPASGAQSSTAYASRYGTPALKRNTEPQASPEDGSSNSDASGEGNTPEDTASAAPAAVAEVPPAQRTAWPEGAWPQFIERVLSERIRLGSLLQHAAPRGLAGGTATIAVPDGFHRDTLKEQRPFLRDHLPEAAARLVEDLRFVVEAGAEAAEDGETASETDPYEVLRTLRAEHPVVRALFDTFDGEPVYR